MSSVIQSLGSFNPSCSNRFCISCVQDWSLSSEEGSGSGPQIGGTTLQVETSPRVVLAGILTDLAVKFLSWTSTLQL